MQEHPVDACGYYMCMDKARSLVIEKQLVGKSA